MNVDDIEIDYLLRPCPFCGRHELGFGREVKAQKALAIHTGTRCPTYDRCKNMEEFRKAIVVCRNRRWPRGKPIVSTSASIGGDVN